MDYAEEEKELACKICDEEDGFGICERKPDEENCRTQLLFARRVLAAGYRKIDPEKLTIISQDEANVACLKRDRNRPYPKGTAGYIEVTQTMLEAQLAHTKRQLQDMEG